MNSRAARASPRQQSKHGCGAASRSSRIASDMSDADDIDGLAAEYVVGSLDALERKEVAARRKVDATLDAAIRAWENRLGALSDAVPKVEPPQGLFLKIAREVWRPAAEPVRT